MAIRFLSATLATSLLVVSVSAFSAVKVVESKSVEQQAREQEQEQQSAIYMQLYNQFQMMQEEVMQLRGMVEQHEYQLAELKQQQRDDYLQLDSRISELNSADAPSANEADDEIAYKEAYQLIQERKFKEALAAFEQFLQNHSQSAWRANVYYWLGELYIVEDNVAKARESFDVILKQFKDDRKYPDALYRLAGLDVQQGKKQAANEKLNTLLAMIEDNPSYVSLKEKALALKNQHFP